jgi:alkylated DNA repair dioxygenase AlkB
MAVQFNFFEKQKNDSQHDPSFPGGFRYQRDFIDRADEISLVERIAQLPFREFEFHGYLGKRRVVSFGWQYDYSGQRLREAEHIPEYLLGLRSLAASFARLEPEALQQVLVTEYALGAGIGWHRDKTVFGEVVGISLLAPCVLRFRRKLTNKPTRAQRGSAQWERLNLLTEPRSAYLLSGPSRSNWEHSILRVNELRYSITFRKVLEASKKR